MKKFMKLGVLFVALTSSALLATTTFVFAMPDETEIAIGRAVDARLKKQYGVFENQGIQKYIEYVGLKIVNVSNRRDMVYHFVTLDTDEINAIASVGGYVYITKGFLKKLDSESKLAAALATEIMHIAGRHGIRDIEKSMQPDMKTVLTKKDTLLRGINTAYNIIELGLNKKLQFDADIKGAECLLNAGYDPEAMVKMLDVIQIEEKQNRLSVADFLITHYKTTKRIDSVRRMLENLRAAGPVKYDSVKGNNYPEKYKSGVLDIICH